MPRKTKNIISIIIGLLFVVWFTNPFYIANAIVNFILGFILTRLAIAIIEFSFDAKYDEQKEKIEKNKTSKKDYEKVLKEEDWDFTK